MRSLRVGVVGGSIAGSAVAALLAPTPHQVVVFERSAGLDDRGGGISLALPSVEMLRDRGLVGRLPLVLPTRRTWHVADGEGALGRILAHQPVVATAVHWGLLHRELLDRVDAGTYRTSSAVDRVQSDDGGATVTTTDGEEHVFDLVVGADGYRSLVRAQLFPDVQPQDAGYALWRGIVDEAAVPDAGRMGDDILTVGTDGGHALFYLVPGRDGETDPGRRRLNWVWYDAGISPDLFGPPPTTGDGRPAIVGVAPGAMSDRQRAHLLERAEQQLPPWFRDAVRASPAPYVQEILDLALDRFTQGRVCLVGDAASIGRPHTASATLKAIQDAVALADALDEEPTIAAALERYDRERSAAGRQLVELGRRLGQQQVVDAPDWSVLDQARFDEWFRTGRTSTTWFSKEAERG